LDQLITKKKEKPEISITEIVSYLFHTFMVVMLIDKIDLPEWAPLNLHPALLKALKELNFTEPTAIQRATIPAAIHKKDIVGAAETGSGKTLAFGIPILHSILYEQKEGLRALIISPTRELALQITQHMTAVAKYTNIKV
jgi:ATP-dependent RNA helicase DDX24/MAK5